MAGLMVMVKVMLMAKVKVITIMGFIIKDFAIIIIVVVVVVAIEVIEVLNLMRLLIQ